MFKVETGLISAFCESMKNTSVGVSECETELSDCIRTVRGMKGMEEAVGLLEDSRNGLEEEQACMRSFLSALERVNETYTRCENQVIFNADGYFAGSRYNRAGLMSVTNVTPEGAALLSRMVI